MLFNFFKMRNFQARKMIHSTIDQAMYRRVVRDLEESKYGRITEEEEEFIVVLMQKLEQSKEKKLLKLHRLSDKTINVSYDSYPIGKIKLQGQKTSMQILLDLYDHKVIRDCPKVEYNDSIDLWIKYIKKMKRI